MVKELKERWDSSKSPASNLESLGLLAQPNQLNNSEKKSPQESVSCSVIELFDVPDSDNAKPSLRKRYPLEKAEEEYIANCMSKWGVDYTSMFQDIKVNDMQHTEQKLRKMGTRYLLLTEEQRRVPVPENVQALLPND